MKTVTIDELLNWAFVHELPKGGGVEGLSNGNSAWATIIGLGTRIDSGVFGSGLSENFIIEQGEPNPDALAAGRAVADLGLCDLALPASWNVLGDWAGDARADDLAAQACEKVAKDWTARPARQRGEALVALVISAAVLNRAPDWSGDCPKIRMAQRAGRDAWFVRRTITDVYGHPYEAEVDGYNSRSGRPVRGAYRKYQFSDDPTAVILSRLDFQLWVAARDVLVRALTPVLEAHWLAHVPAEPSPWLPGSAAAALVARPVEARQKGSKAA